MRTENTNTTHNRRTMRENLGRALLLLAATLLLQGCATVRPAWSYETDADPLMRSAFERTEPREGIAILNLRF